MNRIHNSYDVIIVGHGLAGTALSYHLIKKKKKVLVINKTDKQHCPSYIAAGIYSPIAGQRLASAWLVEELFSYLPVFYRELESVLNTRFFYPMPYIILCYTKRMQNFAQRRLEDPRYKPYITPVEDQYFAGKKVPALSIHQSGYVDLPTLHDAYQSFLQQHDMYRQEWFDASLLSLTDGGVSYNNIHAKQLVFCTGLQAADNPFFADLQFNPVKGQVITVKMPTQLDHILTTDIFTAPMGNNIFRVGATYERDFIDDEPTQACKKFLCEQLELMIDAPYQVIDHKSGIRPTTIGHRPFVLQHPIYHQLAVLSGLGSKGVSLAPYMAKQLADQLIDS